MIKAGWKKFKSALRGSSIRRQLVVFLIVIIVPFIAMSIYVQNYYSGVITRNLTESRMLMLGEMSRNVGQLLKGVESVSMQVRFENNVQYLLANEAKNTYEDADRIKRAIASMEKVLFSSDSIASLYVIPANIRSNYYTKNTGFMLKEYMKDVPWYRDLDKSANVSFWVPTRINENNPMVREYVFTYVAPVLQITSYKVLGHVLVSYKEKALEDLLHRDGMEPGEKILLLGSGGKVFYASDKAYSVGYKSSEAFDTGALSGDSGSFSCGTGNNGTLVTYTKIPGMDWMLISEIPVGVFQSDIHRVNGIIVPVIAVCIALSVAMALLLYWNVTKPLGALARRMGSIGEGNFSVSRPSGNTGNEIAKINSDFDHMTARIETLLERNAQIIRQKNTAEFKALQAQINPHFLYNTLDAINWLAMLNGQQDISDMVKNLSLFFRNTLSDGRQMVTIEEEINQVDVYIRIERFRYKNRFDVEYNLDRRLFRYYTLKFMLQPFVENCLIHGFRERAGQGKLYIQLSSRDDAICFEVIDDGRGMTDEQIGRVLREKTSGYGIVNVDERIKLKFGERFGVDIRSEPGKGTTVSVLIPRLEETDGDESGGIRPVGG